MKRNVIVRLLSVFSLAVVVCFHGMATANENDIVDGVGVVIDSGGKKSPTIYVLDEHHNSAKAQLEQAVILERLYKQQKLRDIALEGYLFSDPRLNASWFKDASNNNRGARVRVAVHLLGEGEISAAEFMALVYDDIEIHPIEKRSEYNVDSPKGNVVAIQNYLLLMAEHQGAQLNSDKVAVLQKSISSYKELEKNHVARHQLQKAAEEVRKARDIVFRDMISKDSWLLEQYEFFLKPMDSLDEWVERARAIKARAETNNVNASETHRAAIEQFIDFYGGRAKASKTMAEAVIAVADKASGGSVALIIGAGHTIDVNAEIAHYGRRFISIRPVTTSNVETFKPDIDYTLWIRRADGHSLYSEGFMRIVNELVDNKKNPPTINEAWLQTKAELYLIVDQLTEAVLGSGGGGGRLPPSFDNGGIPPGFPPNNRNRKWVGFDPNRLMIVPDKVESKEYYYLSREAIDRLRNIGLPTSVLRRLEELQGSVTVLRDVASNWPGMTVDERYRSAVLQETRVSGAPALLFPVVLNYQNQSQKKELWVKAARSRSKVQGAERENVESLLLAELERARNDTGIKEPRLEDKNGRVQVSLDAVMTIGTDLETVRGQTITTI